MWENQGCIHRAVSKGGRKVLTGLEIYHQARLFIFWHQSSSFYFSGRAKHDFYETHSSRCIKRYVVSGRLGGWPKIRSDCFARCSRRSKSEKILECSTAPNMVCRGGGMNSRHQSVTGSALCVAKGGAALPVRILCFVPLTESAIRPKLSLMPRRIPLWSYYRPPDPQPDRRRRSSLNRP